MSPPHTPPLHTHPPHHITRLHTCHLQDRLLCSSQRWGRHHSMSCIPPAGVTHERPLLRPTPTLFDLTWSFIKTGCPEHFTFPSVVQQMCSNGTKDRLGVGEREPSLSERHRYQLWPLFFFFSLHANLHVLTSTLLHRQGDS